MIATELVILGVSIGLGNVLGAVLVYGLYRFGKKLGGGK